MTQYEKDQSFNKVLDYVHNIRFKNVLKEVSSFSKSNPDKVISILDIGCAYGKLFGILDSRFNINYIGIEPSKDFVLVAKKHWGDKKNFTIFNDYAQNVLPSIKDVDIVISLETLEHIPENVCVRVVELVKKINPKLFLVSVPVEIGPSIWMKNIFSILSGYSRHKEYTWKETFYAGLGKLDKLPPHGTGHKGFDYRWLAQTIRHNFSIIKIKKSPISFLSAYFSISVFFVAKVRT